MERVREKEKTIKNRLIQWNEIGMIGGIFVLIMCIHTFGCERGPNESKNQVEEKHTPCNLMNDSD